MDKTEIELQNAVRANFLSNMAFFCEYDNTLYQRIDNLSNAINTELYKPRFELEFIIENGEFDILDLTNNIYLYDKKLKFFNHNIIKKVKFDKSSTFSILVPELYNLENKYTDINLDYESYEEIEGIITNNIKEFTEILKDDTTGEKKYKYINKFVFLGTLLGRHFFDIKNKIKSQNYFIYESNLEIFRLSLFTVNYRDLAQDCNLSFSIMDDNNILIEKFQLFLEKNMYENYNIKFATTNYNVSNGMHAIISTLYKINPALFDYTRILHNLIRLSTRRVNSSKILMPKRNETFQSIKNKPFLFIAPGPSLAKEISWIKKNQDKFVIVAIGASYKKLLDEGINPDILSNVESSYKDLTKYQFSDVNVRALENCIKLFSIITPPQICEMFENKDIFFYEVNYSLKNKEEVYRGYSVGEITVSLLLDLDIKDLYLIGTDLSIDKETGNSHFGYKSGGEISHNINKKYDITENLKEGKTFFKEELIPVEGNFEKEVFTTRLFMNSIVSYAESINRLKKDYQVVKNLSFLGAKLCGAIPYETKNINLDNYDLIDKSKLKNELTEFLDSISESKLTNIEINHLKEEISFFKEIFLDIDKFEKENLNSFFEFYDMTVDIENRIKLIGYPTFLNFLMQSYFKFTNTYLCYYFNEKKIKDEIKKLEEIKIVWLRQVKQLIKEYLNYFEELKI